MKLLLLLPAILFISCSTSEHKEITSTKTTTMQTDTVQSIKDTTVLNKPVQQDSAKPGDKAPAQKFENQRFRDVTVEKISENQYRVKGKGQIFEAAFSWVVEDGHNELKTGHEMTDAGAPEWGNFDFTVDVKKARENSTLHLILFEASAKDGSRQHELHLPLL